VRSARNDLICNVSFLTYLEHRLPENGEDRLPENLAQQRPAFFREPGLSAVRTALSLTQVESGIPEQSSSGTEVRKRAGLAYQAREVKEGDALQVRQLRKLTVGYALAADRLDLGAKGLSAGRKAGVVGPEGLQPVHEQPDFRLGFVVTG